MRKNSITLMVSILVLIFIVSTAYAGHMMGDDVLIGSLIGATVMNHQGENLGRISDIIFNTKSETITFAILTQERVKGMDGKLIPVPMNSFMFQDNNRVILNMTREKLATAPSFSNNNWPDLTNRKWNKNTYKFYGARPYWKEERMEKMMEEEAEKEKYKYKGPTRY